MIFDAITEKIKENLDLPVAAGQPANIDTMERTLSLIAGVYLSYKSLGQFKKHPFMALQEAVAGGLLIYRGATGFCPVYAAVDGASSGPSVINITETFIVDRPREEVYSFWRRLENMPRFMKHLSSVEEHDSKRSHWRANIPGEILKLSWNAEIVTEDLNNYIGWKSVEGSMVDNAGSVTFHDEINGTGTELTVNISYVPPAGSLGHGVAKLLSGVFENMVRHDITNFKHYIEGEEYQTFEHKPAIMDHVENVVNSFK